LLQTANPQKQEVEIPQDLTQASTADSILDDSQTAIEATPPPKKTIDWSLKPNVEEEDSIQDDNKDDDSTNDSSQD